MQDVDRSDFDPELLEQPNSVYRELVEGAEIVGGFGISPGMAALIVASVPITLKLLRMGNELVSASIEDWLAGRRITRRKEEADAELEIEAKRHRQRIQLQKEAREAGVLTRRRRAHPQLDLSYEEPDDDEVDIIEA